MTVHCSNCGMNNKYRECINETIGNIEKFALECQFFIPIDVEEERKEISEQITR